MNHNEAMETINSLIGQAWLAVTVTAVVFLVVVNGFKDQPRSVRGAAAANVVAVREAVATVAGWSGHLLVWFALALLIPYSIIATLNTRGVWVLVVSFGVVVLIELAQLVGKIWRKLRRRTGDHGAVPVTAPKAKGAAVVAGDTIKAVRDDVAALSQDVVSLRETISGERDEARQGLASLLSGGVPATPVRPTEPTTEEPQEISPRRWRSVRDTRPGATTLSIVSIAIAVLALLLFSYTIYEDIKPTLVAGLLVTEDEPFERTEKVTISVSVSNTGRRKATDVRIRVESGGGCEVDEHRFGQLLPGYRAVPWFDVCESSEREWILVNVSYKWDMGWFAKSYRTIDIFHLDDYATVDIAPY